MTTTPKGTPQTLETGETREQREEQELRELFADVEEACHAFITGTLRIHADIFEEICQEAGRLPPDEFIAMADAHVDELASRLKQRIRSVAGSNPKRKP